MPTPSREPRRRRRSDDVIHISGRAPVEDPDPAEGVDVAQLWTAVRERKGFVWTVATLLFCGVMAHTMLSLMTFRSSGRLYLGELELRARSSATGNAAQLDISGGGQGDISSEIEILKSQSLVTKAIIDSGRNVSIAPVGWRSPRFWQWVVDGRNPHSLDIPAREIAVVETFLADDSGGSRTYGVHFVSPTEYDVTAVDESGQDALIGHGQLNKPIKVAGLQTMRLLAGTERGPATDQRYVMVVHPLDAVLDATLAALSVTAPKTPSQGTEGAKVLTLEFTDSSPQAAATFLRVLMSSYLGERQTWKTEDASAAESFVTQQLRSLRNSLDTTQKRLADYRSNTRVVVHENEANAMVEQVGKYEEQRVQARLQVAALTDIKRVLKQPNPPTEAYLFGEANDTVLEGLSSNLSATRNQLNDSLQQFGPGAPQTRQAELQLQGQLASIRNYVNNRLARAQENLAELNRIITQFENKLKTVPGAEFGLAQLGRESEVYSRVYSYMLERQQQAAIIKASTVSKNRILDYPQVPYREDAPKLGLRLASGPIALLFGALLVIVMHLFATSLQSESEVRRTVGNLPIFASVPLRVDPKREANTRSIDPFGEPLSPAFAEAFRTLRANLYQDMQSDTGRVVLITSPVPGDGKTTTVLALAGILAADGRRVLVIDADLRKPSHHDLTNQSRRQGLREILARQARWEDVVSSVELSMGKFDSIGAGQQGPAELLSGERTNRLLGELRERYDYILLDCASFPVVADPLVLSQVSDCVLSVFRLRHTPAKLAGEHTRRLAMASLSYGIVVNDTNRVGSVYPEQARPSFFDALLDRWDEVVNVKKKRAIRASTWFVAALLIVGLAGVVALVQRRSTSRSYDPAPAAGDPFADTMAAPDPEPAALAPDAVDPATLPDITTIVPDSVYPNEPSDPALELHDEAAPPPELAAPPSAPPAPAAATPRAPPPNSPLVPAPKRVGGTSRSGGERPLPPRTAEPAVIPGNPY